MTYIKIYVVKTELFKDITYLTYEEKENLEKLEALQTQFLNEFGGLTVIKGCVGLWVNSETVKSLGYKAICKDNIDIWEIYTNRTIKSSLPTLRDLNLKIKVLTKQISQMFTINNKAYFL